MGPSDPGAEREASSWKDIQPKSDDLDTIAFPASSTAYYRCLDMMEEAFGIQ